MHKEDTTDLLSMLEDVLRFCEREGAESEVYGTKKRETIVSLERNDINLCTQQHITGIGIRTLIKNSLGFACCNSLEPHTAKETAAKAVRMSRKTPPLPFNTFASPRPLPVVPGLYDPHVQDFDEEAAICTARTMLSTAREDPCISVDNGEFFVSAEEKAIVTSCGITASERRSRFSWYVVGMARKGSEVGPYEYQYGCTVRVKDLYVEETAKKLAENAVATLHPQKIESFSGDLILGPEAVSTMIGDPMAFAANAHNVHMKQSVLAGRLGEKISSDDVTIVDDSTLPGDYNSSAFDREGSPHQAVTIVDKGILKSFMHHSMTAKIENKSSTGNATGSFAEMPRIDITNFIIEKSSRSIQAILEETDKGLIVSRYGGAGEDMSGDFSGALKGAHFIKSGEIQYPVKETTVTGNLFEILPRICAVSAETLRCSKMVLPYVKIAEMQFTS
jgi:PmbA protein